MAEPLSNSTETTLAKDDPGQRGHLVIAGKVVERVAAIAASEIEAVTAQRSGWRLLPGRALPKAEAKVAGDRARIGVEIAAAWPSSLAEVTAQTRTHVRDRVIELVGLTVTAVDVTVGDVVHVETRRRRVS